jgi:hypothetical protein
VGPIWGTADREPGAGGDKVEISAAVTSASRRSGSGMGPARSGNRWWPLEASGPKAEARQPATRALAAADRGIGLGQSGAQGGPVDGSRRAFAGPATSNRRVCLRRALAG